jgi:hypothetical protein
MRNPLPAGQPEGMATGRSLLAVLKSSRVGDLRAIEVESPVGPKLLAGCRRRGRLRNGGADYVYRENGFA